MPLNVNASLGNQTAGFSVPDNILSQVGPATVEEVRDELRSKVEQWVRQRMQGMTNQNVNNLVQQIVNTN